MVPPGEGNDAKLSKFRTRFEWSLQALALPAEIQPTLFPPFVAVPDELALDFDNCWMAYRDNLSNELTPEQLDAISVLDKALCEMSGPGKPEIWSVDACLEHAAWSNVRRLASMALATLGWKPGMPPSNRSIYRRYSPEEPDR